MQKLVSTNPGKNFEKIGEVPASSEDEIREKVLAAHKAKKAWKELGVEKRTQALQKVYDSFLEVKDRLAPLITEETGKAIRSSRTEVEGFFEGFEWFLENGKKALEPETVLEGEKSITRIFYEPWGVSAVILPWNYPLDLFSWGVFPNLIAGNTVVAKHSEECPLIGKALEEGIQKAGLPEGVFSEVYGDKSAGKALLEQNIDFLWFTGSSNTGKFLYELVGKKFIKCLLELGGSNPGIVFEDAATDKIIETIVSKRFKNCGQVCNSLKRLLVHESVFDEVVEKIAKSLEKKVTGNPLDEKTDFGSLVSRNQLEALEAQVKDAVSKGAKIIAGGKRPEGLKGAYYLPTVLTNVSRDMRVWREEVFGPVLPVMPFKSEENAIRLANDTPYGLGAIVFTRDRERFRRVASRIDAGAVDMNRASIEYEVPFGGYKASGMGRELGKIGFQELCQVKAITEQK